jgi:hypothetical protein
MGKGLSLSTLLFALSENSLPRGAAETIANYQSMVDAFVSQGTSREAKVWSIVVGSRGAIPKVALKVLTILGLDGKFLGKNLAICAVCSSVEIACMQMDYTLYPSRFAPTCFKVGKRVANQ